jgi:ribokinase
MKPAVISVVGSFAVGMTLRTNRMPVFGETLLASDFDLGPGGKGSNQAVAAARLGAKAHFIGLIGNDALGQIATQLYSAEGVDAACLRRSDKLSTGVGFIIINPEGKNGILLDMGANKHLDRALVVEAESTISQSDAVLSVLEIPVEAAWAAMQLGRKHNLLTILNPAPATALPEEMFRSIDILTPNEVELRILMGLRPDDTTPTAELGAELQRRYGVTVIVTRGENGVLMLDKTGAREVPAATVNVVDTTGAGDAFTAALAVLLAEGAELTRAVQFGCCHGALACTKLGVIPALARRPETENLWQATFAKL